MKLDEQMNVILDSIGDIQLSAELSDNSAKVRKEPRFKRGVDQRPSIFGRENDVGEKVGIAVWHSPYGHAKVPAKCYLGNTFLSPAEAGSGNGRPRLTPG